jgi:hypothetical protein
MPSPSAVRTIGLDKLVLSPTNVRKTPPSAAEEAELKASIRARGLKQNLVVHPASLDRPKRLHSRASLRSSARSASNVIRRA